LQTQCADQGGRVVSHHAVAEFACRVVGSAMTTTVGGEDLEVLGEGRKVRCPGLGGCGSAVNEQQRFALAVDFVIDPKSVGLDVRSCGCHLRELSSMDRYSLCGILAVGYSLRDDLGDVLGGVEVGGEQVLGQRERDPGPSVGVGVAPAHAPTPKTCCVSCALDMI
jgi:hypothetical protein